MDFKTVLTPSAKKDFDQAFAYYFDNVGYTVAQNFLNEVNWAFETLKINPYYQVRKGKYRAFPLSIFPFLIFFELLEERKVVKILSIFHTSQDPKKYPH